MAVKYWARIQNNLVAEVIQLDASLTPGVDVFHPSIAFVECSNTTVQGELYNNNGSFSPAPGPTQSVLINSAELIQQKIASAGITINVNATGTPSNVFCSTDTLSRIDLQGAYLLAQANNAFTTPWVTKSGTTTLTAPQLLTMAQAAGMFIDSTYVALAIVIGKIMDGTYTTFAQVISDPGWPASG